MEHSAPLDGLRAVAIACVIAFHFTPFAPGGDLGVDLFFVLSGFLITTLLIDEVRRRGSVDLVAFYWRRFFRLAPALVLFVAVVAPAQQVVTGWDRPFTSSAISLAYLSNFAVAGSLPEIGAPYLHTWSLAMEEQFYLIWPMVLLWICAGFSKRLVPLCLGFTAVCIFTLPLWVRLLGEGPVYFLPPGHLSYLSAGLVIAGIRARAGALIRLPASVTVTATAALAFLVVTPFRPVDPAGRIAVAFCATLAVAVMVYSAAAPRTGWWTDILSLPVLVWLGQRSYGLYLYHIAVFSVLGSPHLGLPLRWSLPAGLIATLTVAAASFRFVESPVRRRGRAWLSRRPVAEALS